MSIQTFFVDLDDTIYPVSSGIWELIRIRIRLFMEEVMQLPPEKIPEIRRTYFDRYGTTLRGLIANYHIDPEEYLAYVHDVPIEDLLQPDPELGRVLRSYPQRKIILTNADDRHSQRVLNALQIADCFDEIIDVHKISPACKPQPEAFYTALQIAGENDPSRCIFLDDAPRNLATARQIGFTTVLVGSPEPHSCAHYAIASLKELPQILPNPIEETVKK